VKKKYDYNTTRKFLKLPEYGRNIQKMVDYMKTIEDREERNKAARTIISIMEGMLPHNKDLGNYEHKLWDHLAIMADFDLDIDTPYELPTQEKMNVKPRKISYSTHGIRFKHYGYLVEEMLRQAAKMEEGEEKQLVIAAIANHMKRQYLTWNRNQVTDEVIFKDMEEITNGDIRVPDGLILKETKELVNKYLKRKKNQHKR